MNFIFFVFIFGVADVVLAQDEVMIDEVLVEGDSDITTAQATNLFEVPLNKGISREEFSSFMETTLRRIRAYEIFKEESFIEAVKGEQPGHLHVKFHLYKIKDWYSGLSISRIGVSKPANSLEFGKPGNNNVIAFLGSRNVTQLNLALDTELSLNQYKTDFLEGEYAENSSQLNVTILKPSIANSPIYTAITMGGGLAVSKSTFETTAFEAKSRGQYRYKLGAAELGIRWNWLRMGIRGERIVMNGIHKTDLVKIKSKNSDTSNFQTTDEGFTYIRSSLTSYVTASNKSGLFMMEPGYEIEFSTFRHFTEMHNIPSNRRHIARFVNTWITKSSFDMSPEFSYIWDTYPRVISDASGNITTYETIERSLRPGLSSNIAIAPQQTIGAGAFATYSIDSERSQWEEIRNLQQSAFFLRYRFINSTFIGELKLQYNWIAGHNDNLKATRRAFGGQTL
jgi:hypothetical protein